MSNNKKQNPPKNIVCVMAALSVCIIAVFLFKIISGKEIIDINFNKAQFEETEEMTAEMNQPITDAASNEQIVYIKPQLLYDKDDIKISVSGYVENNIYGQGILFNYTNMSHGTIDIDVKSKTEAGNPEYNSNVEIKEKESSSGVFYLGLNEPIFVSGKFYFKISKGTETFETEVFEVSATRR